MKTIKAYCVKSPACGLLLWPESLAGSESGSQARLESSRSLVPGEFEAFGYKVVPVTISEVIND